MKVTAERLAELRGMEALVKEVARLKRELEANAIASAESVREADELRTTLNEALRLLRLYRDDHSCECGREDNGWLCRKICDICDLARATDAVLHRVLSVKGD